MKIPRRAILLSLALASLLGLAIWNRAFLITWLIEPIARILWLIYRTFLSVDQETYWILLILAAITLAILIIPIRTEASLRSAYQYSVHENDRVAYWDTLMKSAIKSESDHAVLRRNLETLQRSINGQSKGNDEAGILLPPFKKRGYQQRLQAVCNSLPLSRTGLRRGRPQATELEKTVDTILQSMETQLEIHHD